MSIDEDDSTMKNVCKYVKYLVQKHNGHILMLLKSRFTSFN